MALVRYDQDPKLTDTVIIRLETTDADGVLIDPYRVDKVVVYFLERDLGVGGIHEFTDDTTDPVTQFTYTRAIPIKVYGTDGVPAWLSTDTDNALIEKVDLDEDDNPLTGVFEVDWTPEHAKEGDYFVCWTWTPIISGTKSSNYLRFKLYSDTRVETSLPTYRTVANKYETLTSLYTPETYKTMLADLDISPDVIDRTNQAVSKGFTFLEDFVNKLLSLNDANVVPETLLPYLANLYSWKLKSSKPALWRRQVKRAIPLYKKKGTYGGLQEALEESDMKLTQYTQYWQVVSSAVWTDSFVVADDPQSEFVLSRNPLDPLDLVNFSLEHRPEGDTSYDTLTDDYVSFATEDGVTIMTWLGEEQLTPLSLSPGDVVKVTYAFAVVTDQSNEDYLATLPLMDQRDEADVCYPEKNWNVRLIAEDDPMFDVLVPTRHPFHDPVVFGKVRTEFPYSENIYNMEEYNGSTRDSSEPCDIDLYFKDTCGACLSSNIALDIEVKSLTDDRITEAEEICKEFIPFHAVIHSINYNGSFEEAILPPVEEIETYIHNVIEDNVLTGNMTFNRSIQPDITNLKRNMLASTSSVASASNGVGYNLAISMYVPATDFATDFSGLTDDNMLEILSGLNTGTYSVSNPSASHVDINEELASAFDSSAFPFNLSNRLYQGGVDVYQDDVFVFTDANTTFSTYNIVSDTEGSPWKIVVTTGLYAGTYTIHKVMPDNSLVINGWPTTGVTTGLNYDLRTDTNVVVMSSVTGKVSVSRRGRLECSTSLLEQFGIQAGDYVRYDGTDYLINETVDDSTMYIVGWDVGTAVGIASVEFFRRLVSEGVGYLQPRGMRLSTATNHYVALGVSSALEDNKHIENFTVLIGTTYYQIASWSAASNSEGRFDIVLNGLPVENWGTPDMGGTTNVTYSIIQFSKTSPVTIGGTQITRIDRRGQEVISEEVETAMPMFMNLAGPILNAANRNQPFEYTQQHESITFEIEWLDEPQE